MVRGFGFFAAIAIAVPVARAQVATNVEFLLSAAPSADPVAASQGLYLPGETVPMMLSLRTTAAPIPDVWWIQVDYFASGPSIVNYDSGAIVPGFPLTDVHQQGSLFVAGSPVFPSVLTLPVAPASVPFMTFTANAPAGLNQTATVNLLGACSSSAEIDSTAVISRGGAVYWNCDFTSVNDIVGGVAALTTVPEPGAALAVAVGLLFAVLHRRMAV